MAKAKCTEEEFIDIFETKGPAHLEKKYGLNRGNISKRRQHIERKLGRSLLPRGLESRSRRQGAIFRYERYPHRIPLSVRNGFVIVAGDCHYLPHSKPTAAHRALVAFCKEYSPKGLLMNGDLLDLPQISRFDSMHWVDWEKRPTVADELEYTTDRLHELEQAVARDCLLAWNWGNHDRRFEMIIANKAPELAKIKGVHLKDHFPNWEPAWATWINDHTVVKHRDKSGIHAVYNNVLRSGKNIITNDTHALNVRAFSDYNGTRYGADAGMIAEPYDPQFVHYTEDRAKDWRSGFLLLTIEDGRLHWPEVIHAVDQDTIEFRGKFMKV